MHLIEKALSDYGQCLLSCVGRRSPAPSLFAFAAGMPSFVYSPLKRTKPTAQSCTGALPLKEVYVKACALF